MNNLSIDNLSTLQDTGVYVLTAGQNVYIGYGKNMLSSIYNLLQALRLGTKNYHPTLFELYRHGSLQLSVLETCSEEALRIRAAFWYEYFKSATSHTMLNKITPVSYSTEIRIVTQFKDTRAAVFLVPAGNRKASKWILVGVFPSLGEAQTWAEDKYPKGRSIANISIADNNDTKKWRDRIKDRKLVLK